jgi:predicted tellurium resistance membrane protein TerC
VYRHFGGDQTAEERRAPREAKAWIGLPPFWATVVKVELTDLVFAIDSILVGVAMSPKIWVVITGGFLGIVMMRLLIGQLLTIVERYPPLVDGAFVIISWVGAKLLVEFLHARGYIGLEIPTWFSLVLIVIIFSVAFVYAIMQERSNQR